jgi:hypothetical protein
MIARRLANQHLTGRPLATPESVVERLGAVQAQDYAGAKWAIAQRTAGATDADVEAALSEGRLLRTHVLRPTWHIVTAAELRWMLDLTAPRVRARMAVYDRRLGLDDDTSMAPWRRRCETAGTSPVPMPGACSRPPVSTPRKRSASAI